MLRDTDLMALCVPGAERPRTLRRVRRAAVESARSIISATARILPPPLPISRPVQVA